MRWEHPLPVQFHIFHAASQLQILPLSPELSLQVCSCQNHMTLKRCVLYTFKTPKNSYQHEEGKQKDDNGQQNILIFRKKKKIYGSSFSEKPQQDISHFQRQAPGFYIPQRRFTFIPPWAKIPFSLFLSDVITTLTRLNKTPPLGFQQQKYCLTSTQCTYKKNTHTHTYTFTVYFTDHNNSWSRLINNTHFCAQGKANLPDREEEWGINEVDMYLRI